MQNSCYVSKQLLVILSAPVPIHYSGNISVALKLVNNIGSQASESRPLPVLGVLDP
jgi:hypothetical protein